MLCHDMLDFAFILFRRIDTYIYKNILSIHIDLVISVNVCMQLILPRKPN